MKGRDLPSYISRRKRDGVLLFRKRYGTKIIELRLETQFPEGDPVPFALHQERERLLNQPTPVAPGSTVTHVIARYVASDRYRRLKPRTRDDYDKRLIFLREKIGHLHPRSIERHHVIAWVEAWAKRSPHEANYRLRVLKIVLERAKDYGLLRKADDNPAKGVEEVRYERAQRLPWPADKVKAMRAAATGRSLLLFELLLGTGQRIGDVLKMRWSDYADGAIQVTQGKRGAKLWIPVTPELRACLDAAPRRAVFILTNATATGAWSYRGAADAMMLLRRQIGATDFDLHALRYTATAELAAAGVSDEDIQAVTGHKTLAMVSLYAGPERQKARASRAQEARERNKPGT